MSKIQIAPAPAPVPSIDRTQLGADITSARALAEKLVGVVVASGVARDIGLSLAAKLSEYADALASALESGAADHEIAPHLRSFRQLQRDAATVAVDPVGMVARHDELATGRAASAPLGEGASP